MNPPVPMARLLVIAYGQMIDSLHERLREAGWSDVRPAHGFVLLATRDRPTTTTELAKVLSVSKQAVSKLLDAMDAGGYVERESSDADGRVKTVVLAERGRRLLAAVEAIYADLEWEWAHVIGRDSVEQLRSWLTEVVTVNHAGSLPPVHRPP